MLKYARLKHGGGFSEGSETGIRIQNEQEGSP